MKPYLVLYVVGLIACLTSYTTFAQKSAFDNSQSTFSAGSWQVGLKEGYGKGNLVKNRNGLHIHTGYYVADKLLVGLGTAWSKEWIELANHSDLSVGPFARYQFATTRLSPFIEASYQFGQRSSTNSGTTSTSIQAGYISPGLSMRIHNQLRADLSYSIQFTRLLSHTETFGQPQLGLNYLFNKN